MEYDYIIIGGGPTGLTLSWYLSQSTIVNKILLIDKNKTLGGCHRVVRTENNLFTEHGPRVYSSAYINTKKLLSNMGLSFDNYFTKYNFGFTRILNNVFHTLHLYEIKSFIKAYINFAINNNYGKNITVSEFMNDNNFSHNTKLLLDNLCRLTDGGDSSRYTLYEFLQLANQNAFYSLYINKIPNDLGLMKDWTNKLIKTNKIDILTETYVTELLQTNNQITGVLLNDNKIINGINFILAIPPRSLITLLQNSSPIIQNSFGNFSVLKEWEQLCRYETYICAMFYWKHTLKTKKTYGGFSPTDWGIMFIELSDYMNFNNKVLMKTGMCIAISKPNSVSKYLNKTPHECTKDELLNEMYRQLNIINTYPEPSLKILYPNIIRKNNKWISKDTAFLLTKAGYGPCKSLIFNNLYSVGVHNGRSIFVPTTMEAAIENAISLVNDLVPNKYKLKKQLTLIDVLFYLIGLILLLCILYLILKLNKKL